MNYCLIMALGGGVLIICFYFILIRKMSNFSMQIVGAIPILMYMFVMFYIFGPQLPSSKPYYKQVQYKQRWNNYYQPIKQQRKIKCKKQNKQINYNIGHVDTLIINK